jgi:hypothetical protein
MRMKDALDVHVRLSLILNSASGLIQEAVPQNYYAENVVRMTHTENEEVVEYTGDARINFEEEEDVASEVDQPPVDPWTEG